MSSRTLRRIRRWGPGRVFVPRDFLDLGQRGAVDAALHRLRAEGKIRHLGRGLYDFPRHHDRLGPLTPSADDIARAVARRTGEDLARSGAAAANLLGLSTQVPARPLYLTSGASRSVQVGNLTIRFKHAAPSSMVGGDTAPGLILRALRFLGRSGIDHDTIRHLRSILTEGGRRALETLRPQAVAWMQPILDRIVNDSEDRGGDQVA